MGTDEEQVQLGAAALAIALTALAIAVAQLMGQLFATADGYRRCQPSVMGAWAKHTKLRWKWSQMRFETLFTTPEIFFCPYDPSLDSTSEQRKTSSDIYWIGDFPGTAGRPHWARVACLDYELVEPNLESSSSQELACWLPFLHSIRDNERQAYRSSSYEKSTEYHNHRRPACRSVQKSWDFMAPELLRPLAATNIGDIAVMVQRLGMKWQAFRPEDGEMRAEGNGHIIYSTLVRSIGPIIHYTRENINDMRSDGYTKNGNKTMLSGSYDGNLSAELILINTAEADMMRFGLIPCHELMMCKRLAMGTINEVCATLDFLDIRGSASKKVRDNRQIDPTSAFGFSDLIAMATPILRLKGSSQRRLPVPTEHCVGLTSHHEGFVVFRQRLGEYVTNQNNAVSSQVLWVLQSYDAFLAKPFMFWDTGALDPQSQDLDEIHDAWDQTTTYFKELTHSSNISYIRLVADHLKNAVNYWHEAHERIRNGTARDHHGLCDWLAEGMHMYWDYLPKIVEETNMHRKTPVVLIHEAWITLMFRAFCWSRCHYFGRPEQRFPDSTRLPSRYWNSKLPVYLG